MTSLVEVNDLRVELVGRGCDVVDEVSFSLDAGRVLGIVGESGSGKTTVAHALLGHARRGTRIVGGTVQIGGVELVGRAPAELRSLRGGTVAYVPQDPSAALNPALRIERQLLEPLEFHGADVSPREARDRIRAALSEVALPSDDGLLARYPHQLSGGQQQRVLLAMAFLLKPRLVVLDEPTTGLDVRTQAQVLRVAENLFAQHEVAAVYVTHDLSVIAQVATEMLVMYSGRVVESGPADRLFSDPRHPYTRRLMAASPDVTARRALSSIPGHTAPPGERPSGCFFHPRCEIALDECRAGAIARVTVGPRHEAACVRANERLAGRSTAGLLEDRRENGSAGTEVVAATDIRASHAGREVLHGISISLRDGECLAVVGESGSGKTTLARCLIGLHREYSGEITFRGEGLAKRAADRPDRARQRLQYIFQSPYGSLNPRQLCGDIVALPISLFDGLRRRAAREVAKQAFERVGLTSRAADRYPDELSGGERQRVAIARALACRPEVLICDEVTSALDVSVQATILELLRRLQQEEGLAMAFITHNLAVVRNIADRVIVMHEGSIVEGGDVDSVLDHPEHAYTERLLADTPAMPTVAQLGPGIT